MFWCWWWWLCICPGPSWCSTWSGVAPTTPGSWNWCRVRNQEYQNPATGSGCFYKRRPYKNSRCQGRTGSPAARWTRPWSVMTLMGSRLCPSSLPRLVQSLKRWADKVEQGWVLNAKPSSSLDSDFLRFMKIKAAQNQHLIFTKHHCLNSQNKESGMMNQICPLLCSFINLLLDREETLALFPHLLLGREETPVLFPHLQVDDISLLFSIISRILSRYRHHEA